MSGQGDDPFLTAGEYVLGAMDRADHLEAELRQARDPAFADAVAFWEQRLTPLAGLVAPLPPPPSLWSRLALATGVRDQAAAAPPSANPRVWQGATAAAMLLAAGLAVVAFLPATTQRTAFDPHFAAALAPMNVTVPFLAEARPDGRITITNLAASTAAPGRSLQLWELPAGASRPLSLGLLPPGQPVVVSASAQPMAQAKLLVSDEPAGGSPTGLPTGAVIYGGTLTQVSAPGR